MQELKIFENKEFGKVRAIEIDNKSYFVGKDVAEILGYAKPLNALATHIDEDDSLKQGLIDSMGRTQETILINESWLYSLILSSKLPKAKQFKHWVTAEVLPSIRKHGAYMTPETLEAAILNPDTIIKIATALKDEQEKNKLLQIENSKLSVNNMIMKPEADYFDELVDRNLLTSFRDTAKELQIKEKIFINFLLDKKYLYRDKKGKLVPTADRNNGLFEVKETFNEKTKWSGIQTLITPKGRETFRLLYMDKMKAC